MKYIFIIGLIFILPGLFFSCNSKTEKSPEEINGELVKIENDILILINRNEKEEALKLVGTLNHPSKEEWEDKEKHSKVLGIEMFDGYYTYNEWWNERRESLQKQILEMSTNNHNKKGSDTNKTELKTKIKDESVSISTNITLKDELLGLYVSQNESGNTQFYKFSKSGDKKNLKIIYQDNIGGNVRIENYNLKSYSESVGEVILESKKNSNNVVKVFFKRDTESSNGYKLVDSDGISYSLVSN